ncbi:MAG: hypothetical protein FH749_12170 [Firmicutes bacterium]|nr:hypothetical protein [Bacillota bacterium]
MKAAFTDLKQKVEAMAGKYSGGEKRRELEQVFELLEKELSAPHLQSQRLMALLRGIMTRQPGSSKAINDFLRNEEISSRLHQGGSFTMD